jgi:hypothetical protein
MRSSFSQFSKASKDTFRQNRPITSVSNNMCTSTKTKRKTPIRGGSEAQFPGKLHDMMAYIEKQGLESIMAWVLNGRAIMVHNPDRLLDVLPMFFGQTKYRSFRRQLNMWHFERHRDGPEKGAFMHPLFVRGNKPLCTYMSRHAFATPQRSSHADFQSRSSMKQMKLPDYNNAHRSIDESTSQLFTQESTLKKLSAGTVSPISVIDALLVSQVTQDHNFDVSDGDLVSFEGQRFFFLDYEKPSTRPCCVSSTWEVFDDINPIPLPAAESSPLSPLLEPLSESIETIFDDTVEEKISRMPRMYDIWNC